MKIFDMLTNEDMKRIKEDMKSTKNPDRPLIRDIEFEELEEINKKLKKRAEEAEGENTIIKGIGLNSPEMKALRKENEKLKAELARAKEDHQYDNLVHGNELKRMTKR